MLGMACLEGRGAGEGVESRSTRRFSWTPITGRACSTPPGYCWSRAPEGGAGADREAIGTTRCRPKRCAAPGTGTVRAGRCGRGDRGLPPRPRDRRARCLGDEQPGPDLHPAGPLHRGAGRRWPARSSSEATRRCSRTTWARRWSGPAIRRRRSAGIRSRDRGGQHLCQGLGRARPGIASRRGFHRSGDRPGEPGA